MTATGYRCRACGSHPLIPVLDLGKMPLANGLLHAYDLEKPEDAFPLVLAYCSSCSLVQITESVPPSELFSNYLYFSSFSDALLQHARELVERTIHERGLNGANLVVEIASNDGYLLQYYRRAGIPVLGIEPATNIARVARDEKRIPTINEFFNRELGQRLAQEGRMADVVHANNVLAHVPDPGGFLGGVGKILKDDGIALIEVPYLRDMLDHVEFDTIYHEHLSYFSVTALDRLCKAHDLLITDVERLPIHGGSIRVHIEHDSHGRSNRVEKLLAEEQQWGVDALNSYHGFGSRVEALKHQLVSLLEDLKRRGKRIAAYGCSAKGSTLLNYAGITRDMLDFVVDRSTAKQGLYTPGTHLPVYGPEKLLEAMPDYALLLTWNFAEEILAQQSEYRQRGGRFIIPVPEPQVL